MPISVHHSSIQMNTPVFLSVLHGTCIEHKWLADENISLFLIGITHAKILTSTNLSVSSRSLSALWELSHCLMDTLKWFLLFLL